MDLFNTSMFSNFSAEAFDFNPQNLCWNTSLDNDVENFVRFNLSDEIDELWLFGLQTLITLDEHIIQNSFVFQKKNASNKIEPTVLIADSWAFTVEALWIKAKNKTINFCIHSSYLANLNDPRPLLLAIKKICLSNNRSRAIIIKDKNFDQFIVRNWSCSSLTKFLLSAGFIVRSSRVTNLSITYFVIHLTNEHYHKHLLDLGLSSQALSTRQLVVSTEDSSIEPSGGIGTYVKNLKSLSNHTVFLYCNTTPPHPTYGKDTLILSKLIDNFYSKKSNCSIDLVEAVKVVLFALPNIDTCEFQDHLAIGFRIVQAKHTGQLPQNLLLRTFLHGNIDHIKFAEQRVSSSAYDLDDIKTVIKDSFIYKYSDSCRIPSKYLLNVMSDEFGYKLSQPHILQPPFDLTSLPKTTNKKLAKIKKIIFIGKYSFQKGWPDFVELIRQLSHKKLLLNINEIISLAPGIPAKEDIAEISLQCIYTYKHLQHAELLRFVSDLKQESLFILPSRGENYPYAILELILSRARFITYSSGGSSEMIQSDEFKNLFFSDPSVKHLVDATSAIIKSPVEYYEQYVETEWSQATERQIFINKMYVVPSESLVNTYSFDTFDACSSSVTITTPVYNTPLIFLEGLLQSICSSSIKPVEWLLINDGSESEYSQELAEFLSKNRVNINIRLINQQNKGLSSARNLGMTESKSKYTLFIDSDDVLLPHTISQGLVALRCSPELVAVSGVSMYFTDAESMPKNMRPIKDHGYWSPLGIPEAKALSLLENQYIPSCILANTEKIKEAGGWDARDKSTWEDWAFCAHLAWNNFRFSLIPNAGFLYRNTPGSMSKTYNQYLGRRRLIRNVAALSRLDANILSAMVMAADPRGADGQHRLEVLLQNTYNSHSWKITAPLRFLSDRARFYKQRISVYLASLFNSQPR